MSVISSRGLCMSYGARRGVIDVDLRVNEGQIFGFLGPNGAGKSTTIRLLMGFLRAKSGEATILGHDCWHKSHVIKRDVGYVPGDLRLYPWLTARRAFRIVSQVHGRDLSPAGEQLADRFKLEPDLPVRKMSRGNRQKVGLVLSMIHHPRLLVLDEPTSGLDPLMQEELAECLREYSRAGQTVFFSSHTLSEVENLCDQVAIVRDGYIVANEQISRMKDRAPRVITVDFEESVDPGQIEWPDFLTLKRTHRQTCILEMQGSSIEFVRWAANQPIADLNIGPPSLEALFRGYYEHTAAAKGIEDQGSSEMSEDEN